MGWTKRPSRSFACTTAASSSGSVRPQPVMIADDDKEETSDLVERLMGKKPEMRFQYIQEHAQFAKDIDV